MSINIRFEQETDDILNLPGLHIDLFSVNSILAIWIWKWGIHILFNDTDLLYITTDKEK